MKKITLYIFFVCWSSWFFPLVFAAGKTPAMTSITSFPLNKTVGQLDLFITPNTDPGPNSHVFWANQINGLKGYTGLQSNTFSTSEGQGKQFLFSLWDATDAKPGTPASSGIGGGSHCTVNNEAVDGQKGAQCRYIYNWQVGHTYRFRVVPDPHLGAGWYKSSVSDVTSGAEENSFDIGSIYKATGSGPGIPVGLIGQWVEYVDWNDSATTCLSVAHTDVTLSVQAFDLQKNELTLPDPVISASNTCPPSSTSISQTHSRVHMVGGPKQSAEGFIQTAGKCLVSSLGEPPQMVVYGTCPTKDLITQKGGENYGKYFWVLASDKTIQQKSNMCLTVKPGQATSVAMYNCVTGQAAQQWEIDPNQAGQIRSVQSGNCLILQGNGLPGLQDCKGSISKWTVPGKSFVY